ncbi:MAG: type II toxin-antitoxin system prevent-host-death family antitoxin [Deltaproteobacteria bacterium]|nr:type II toxin-antitoxin system prevent-host-death family antitoxin [Deltaproteobacteria bacterium]
MRTCSIGNLKTHLSKYLAVVKDGGEIIITDHNRPIAKIISILQKNELSKIDLKSILKMPLIPLKAGAKSSLELLRDIRDEKN